MLGGSWLADRQVAVKVIKKEGNIHGCKLGVPVFDIARKLICVGPLDRLYNEG